MIKWEETKAGRKVSLRLSDLKCGETFRIIGEDSGYSDTAIRMRLRGSQFCTIQKGNDIGYSATGQVFDADTGIDKWDLEVEIVNIEAREV